MSDVVFNPDVLKVLAQTSRFNEAGKQHILMVSEDENVVVRSRSNTQIYTILKTDKMNLGDRTEVAFQDFPNFYSFYKEFAPETLSFSQNKIVLKKGKSRVNYVLSEREMIAGATFSKMSPVGDKVISFALGEDDLREIKKMISAINAQFVRVTVKGNNKVIMSLLKGDEETENSFEKEFDLDDDYTGEAIDLEVKADFFKNSPSLPYLLTITDRGQKGKLFNLHYRNDDFSLDVYVTRKLEN